MIPKPPSKLINLQLYYLNAFKIMSNTSNYLHYHIKLLIVIVQHKLGKESKVYQRNYLISSFYRKLKG